jgi:hypothetical protein
MSATTKPTVFEALAAVMADVQAVKKGDRNDAQRFMFRGIDAVVNAVGPALRKHGVTVSPRVDLYEYGTVTTAGGKAMGHVRVLVTYTFHGPAGDALPAQAPGEAFDAGDKATPKAMSVAFRTALLQALALPTDEPDPDSSSYERAPAQPAQPPRPSAEAQALADLAPRMPTVDDLKAGVYDPAKEKHLLTAPVADPVTGEVRPLSAVIADAKTRLTQTTEGNAA